MKKYSVIILLFLCSAIQAQKKEADTTQHIVANRKNAASTYQKPYVILISADGFRYDYIEKYNAKNLEEIASKNIWAKQGMYPSYPSITFPKVSKFCTLIALLTELVYSVIFWLS